MMENEERLFNLDNVLTADSFSDAETVDLSGFQVTRAELFSHNLEPSITLWPNRIKFNMACLRRFPGVKYIQLLINPEEKRIIIRPCEQDAPDSLRWAVGGGEKDLKNRDMICRIFAARVFDLMKWNPDYRYRILGKPAVCDDEYYYLFKLTDFELFMNSGSKRSKGFLPDEWRNYFGIPANQHEDAYKVNPAEGYVTTDKA